MDLTNVFIVWALTYLISNGLVTHDGPFGLFKRFRYLAGINVPMSVTAVETGELVETGEYESNGLLLAEILECQWCTSVYVSLFISSFIGYGDGLLAVALLWLVSTGVTWFTLDLVDY